MKSKSGETKYGLDELSLKAPHLSLSFGSVMLEDCQNVSITAFSRLLRPTTAKHCFALLKHKAGQPRCFTTAVFVSSYTLHLFENKTQHSVSSKACRVPS